MEDQELELRNVLTARRETSGNGRPLSYERMARQINNYMNGSTLFRFLKGTKNLGVDQLRMIAGWARKNNDEELIQALINYALGPQ